MSNMSHCMFTNTLIDLRDCYFKLRDIEYHLDELSEDEMKAAVKLIGLCSDIAAEHYELSVQRQS